MVLGSGAVCGRRINFKYLHCTIYVEVNLLNMDSTM